MSLISGRSRRLDLLVDRLGDELLADAGLAEDQHGHRRVGDALDERVDAPHRRIEHDRLGAGQSRSSAVARRAAGAQAGAHAPISVSTVVPSSGHSAVAAFGVDAGGAREVEQALDGAGAFGAAELGQDHQVVVARVLGDHVHRAQRARDRIDRRRRSRSRTSAIVSGR